MKARLGMTLIELAAALAITGVVVVTGHAALVNVLRTRERSALVVERTQRAAVVRHTLTRWLSSTHTDGIAGGPAFLGIDPTGTGVNDRLVFQTTAAAPALDGFAIVDLAIDSDSMTPVRGLVARLARPGFAISRVIELEPLAAGLDVWFLGEAEGQRAWLPSWSSSIDLPEAVRLEIMLPRSDSVSAILALPITVRLARSQ